MGILISMFTAIVQVRLLISFWLQRTRPKVLKIATRWHRLPEGTTFRFMRARYSGLVVSAVISLAALTLAYHPGLRMSVEFAGGILLEAQAPEPVDAAALRAKLGGLGLGPVQVQEFGSPNDALLRFEAAHGDSAEQQQAVGKARAGVLEAMPGPVDAKAEEAARRDPALSVRPGSGESFRDRPADGQSCPECPEMVHEVVCACHLQSVSGIEEHAGVGVPEGGGESPAPGRGSSGVGLRGRRWPSLVSGLFPSDEVFKSVNDSKESSLFASCFASAGFLPQSPKVRPMSNLTPNRAQRPWRPHGPPCRIARIGMRGRT
jgi:hypothetical protein